MNGGLDERRINRTKYTNSVQFCEIFNNNGMYFPYIN